LSSSKFGFILFLLLLIVYKLTLLIKNQKTRAAPGQQERKGKRDAGREEGGATITGLKPSVHLSSFL
jgi:hypothetical protein